MNDDRNDRRGGRRQGGRRHGGGRRRPGRGGDGGDRRRGRDRGGGRGEGRWDGPRTRPRPVEDGGRVETTRVVVLPGEELAPGPEKGGSGTYSEEGKVFASQVGIKATWDGRVSVIPLAGRYIPYEGDEVIGMIVDVGPTSWMVDLNSPYVGPLHSDDTQWDVHYGEAGRFLGVGDIVLLRVDGVDALKRVRLSMAGHGLRKLNGGHVKEVSHSKVPRIIGKGGSMIKLLKDRTGCRIHVGQNGRIWIDGEPEGIRLAVEALEMIERNAHTVGLTENVGRFLDQLRGDRVEGAGEERTNELEDD